MTDNRASTRMIYCARNDMGIDRNVAATLAVAEAIRELTLALVPPFEPEPKYVIRNP